MFGVIPRWPKVEVVGLLKVEEVKDIFKEFLCF